MPQNERDSRWVGSGDLTVILNSDLETRVTCNGHSGDLTFLSKDTTARKVNVFSGALNSSGTLTIGDHVYLTSAGGITNKATLVLIGAGHSLCYANVYLDTN